MMVVVRSAIVLLVLVAAERAVLAQQNPVKSALESILVGTVPSAAVLAPEQVDILRQEIAITLNTFPAQTPSSPVVEVQSGRKNYGPIYMSRGAQIGPQTLSTFVTFQHASWTFLDGIDLRSAQLRNEVPGFFGRPATTASASFELSTDTTALGAVYGLTSNVDVSATMPIQHVCVSGTRRVITGTAPAEEITANGCTTGIGDIELRTKYSQLWHDSLWAGFEVGVALPTGDQEQFTGRGQAQTRFSFALSQSTGPFQPQANIGFTLGGHGITFDSIDLLGGTAHTISKVSTPRSIDYGLGASFVFGDQWTLTTEVIARALRHGAEFDVSEVAGGTSVDAIPVGWRPLALAAVGVKYRLAKSMIVSAHTARTLTSAGLRPEWVLGASLAFERIPPPRQP